MCTTELGSVEALRAEFERRGVKVAALSCNDTASHKEWEMDIVAVNQCRGPGLHFPIISDADRSLAHKLGMIDAVARDDKSGLPMTCRAVFIIGPDKTLKLSLLYPASTGHNFGEVLRVLDSLQLTAAHSCATPANWKGGDKCMVLPELSAEEARSKFPRGVEVAKVPSGKEYLRFTPDPR